MENRMNPNIDPSKPLKNQRHEKFARLISQGKMNREAYERVYSARGISADVGASQLLSFSKPFHGKIARRVEWLKSQAATESTLTMKERREWLGRTVKLNLAKLDVEKDGDLIEEIVHEADGRKRYKIASKRACIMDDAKLAGDLIDKTDLTSEGQALPSAMPTIIFNPATPCGRRAKK